MTRQNQWTVSIPTESGAPYDEITFRQRSAVSEDGPYPVVVVDAERFIQCCLHPALPEYVPEVPLWDQRRLSSVIETLPGRGRAPEMPIAVISKQSDGQFGVEFTNGRHRSRLMHYWAVKSFPVEVDWACAELMVQVCGNA